MNIYDTSNEERCTGALNIKGENYRCQLNVNHKGWAHQNTDAKAIWVGNVNDAYEHDEEYDPGIPSD